VSFDTEPLVVPELYAVVDEGGVVFVEVVPLKPAVLPIDVPVAAADVSLLLDVVGAVAEAAGAGVLADVPAMFDELVEEVVVSDFGAFLSLCMSPRANAEPLARATMVVMTKAGASLRI